MSPASPCKEAVCLPWCVFDDREGVQQSCQDHFPWEIFTSTQNQPHIFLSLITLLTNWAEVYARNYISTWITLRLCALLEEVSYLFICQRKSRKTQKIQGWKADCKNPTSKQNQPKCPLFCSARACEILVLLSFPAVVVHKFGVWEMGKTVARMCAGGRRSAESGRSDPFLRARREISRRPHHSH